MKRGNCKVIHGFLLVPLVLVAQSWPTLCNPMDCSLPGSSVHGIFQARILKCVAILFSRGSSQHRDRTWVSLIAGRFSTIWATIQQPAVTIFKIDRGNLSFRLFAQKLLAFCGLRASELKDSGFVRHILWLCPPQDYQENVLNSMTPTGEEGKDGWVVEREWVLFNV